MSTSRIEHDACAIIAMVEKQGRPTHANITRTIESLKKMAHRSGDIGNEGDGCGLLADIPVDVWSRRLEAAGLSRHLAESRGFFVGHFLVPPQLVNNLDDITGRVRDLFAARECEMVLDEAGGTRNAELGPRARAEAPLFWQVGGLTSGKERDEATTRLYHLALDLERELPELHTASLSLESVVYKVRGVPDLLSRVYPELNDEATRSVICLGHSRYSTNTLPSVERAQPFSLLGHNGEINTIERLRSAARALGIPMVPGGSDSQDLDRILAGLIHQFGFDPLEALCMAFPAVHSEVAAYSQDLSTVYDFYRWFFPPSAQGPAAIIARKNDICMGSVDALGLRPLWFGESDYEYFLSSEKGVVDIENCLADPRPLAPGEKVAVVTGAGRPAEVLDMTALQKRLVSLMQARRKVFRCSRTLHRGLPVAPMRECGSLEEMLGRSPGILPGPEEFGKLAALGWQDDDLLMRKRVSRTGKAVIGSMGHTGPLAAMAEDALPNISEYFKENVAVVTNPAIDREREADHFSTRVILGDRPDAGCTTTPSAMGLELECPLLLERGGLPVNADADEIARTYGTACLEDVVAFFTGCMKDASRVCLLDATFEPGNLRQRLDALLAEAVEGVRRGAVLLILDDARSFTDGRVHLDPALVTARLANGLESAGLRRRASIIVRSAAIRNLHDVMVLLGLGADALSPRLLWSLACSFAGEKRDAAHCLQATMDVLQKGMEKVMSTMGIHELCGYGRIFASIGLDAELAGIFRCANFCGIDGRGLGFEALESMATRRLQRLSENDKGLFKAPLRNPRVGKALRGAAEGRLDHRTMAQTLAGVDENHPIGIRHALDFVFAASDADRPSRDEVDISKGSHAMPLIIPAMSFGSQGENSFRAYAEAALRANIICMNGEGGEIPDMLGNYRRNRGQQVASGRFGVFMELLNSADFLEIKIGQGAKPGEGGHLPGTKVTEMVAQARHCKPGITLISPSNHHDIYSIEDLAQIITELKTANPGARISVKIPVTGGVGTIAVGVAKAGADIVNVSGFDGGTGAAREHAKKYVGLPVEIGVAEAHRALVESGLRGDVELWCDGGLRSGADAVKMILLGADRIGLGTAALMGVGCISCRRCHLDRCPRGISTQLRDVDEAESRGVKGFTTVQVDVEAGNLARMLEAIGEEMRDIAVRLGESSLSALVGRTDLLRQVRFTDALAAETFLVAPGQPATADGKHSRVLRRPLNYLTRLISDLAMERFERGDAILDYKDEGVRSVDRAVGTHLAGAMVRRGGPGSGRHARLRLGASVPGNGLAAFNTSAIDILVEGGSQDGAAKGSSGGTLGVLKGFNLYGRRVDGSTGKSFAYGAIGGLLMIQNLADSRACVRLSGADAVFGGRIDSPLRDDLGNLATRSHLKGFAFEYMTGGRVVVLGDPGPWMCSGMTGGVVYLCLYPEFGFDEQAVQRRLAKGANVRVSALDDAGEADVTGLLGHYIAELARSFQHEEARAVEELLERAGERFVMVRPAPSRLEAE